MSKPGRMFRVVQITEAPPESECEGTPSIMLKLEEVSRPDAAAIFISVKWPAREVFLGMMVSIEATGRMA